MGGLTTNAEANSSLLLYPVILRSHISRSSILAPYFDNDIECTIYIFFNTWMGLPWHGGNPKSGAGRVALNHTERA